MKKASLGVLTINGGSSSIKFSLFEANGSLRRIYEGAIERIGQSEATLRVKGLSAVHSLLQGVKVPDHSAAVSVLMDWIQKWCDGEVLSAVGHRVVHGGPNFSEAARITPNMLEELRRLSPFDPQHLPEEILLI